MSRTRPSPARALREHWPEYLMEAWGLGTFMVSAGVFATLLESPGSPVHRALTDPDLRRLLMGLAMGLTAVAIVYSPWGKRSGAHLNPAVTLSFLRLGKIAPTDAAFYMIAQLAGGLAGVLAVWALLGPAFAEPPVDFVNTVPGPAGVGAAFAAELLMAGGLMLMVTTALGSARLAPRIGLLAGALVALYIALLAPLSGMSINPARTFASAAPGGRWDYLWLYFSAPVLGMLLAVELGRLLGGRREGFCAKLCHDPAYRCIHCGHVPPERTPTPPAGRPSP